VVVDTGDVVEVAFEYPFFNGRVRLISPSIGRVISSAILQSLIAAEHQHIFNRLSLIETHTF
jgi:hypothetical protein